MDQCTVVVPKTVGSEPLFVPGMSSVLRKPVWGVVGEGKKIDWSSIVIRRGFVRAEWRDEDEVEGRSNIDGGGAPTTGNLRTCAKVWFWPRMNVGLYIA